MPRLGWAGNLPFFDQATASTWHDKTWLPIGFTRLKCPNCGRITDFRVYKKTVGEGYMMGCLNCGKRKYSRRLPKKFKRAPEAER